MVTATQTKEGSSAAVIEPEKIAVLHNKTHNDACIPNPLRHREAHEADGLIIPARSYVPLDFEPEIVRVWLRSHALKRALQNGHVELLFVDSLDEIPQADPMPEDIDLADAQDRATVNNILYNDSRETQLEIINMVPRMGESSTIDTPYLKANHVRILRYARFVEAGKTGLNRAEILAALDKRISQIERM